MPRTEPIWRWWISLHPAERIDAPFWIAVVDALRAAGIDPEKATPEQVRAAIAAVPG